MEVNGLLERSQKLAGRGALALAILISLCEVSLVAAQSCGSSGMAVQILGSGGPGLPGLNCASGEEKHWTRRAYGPREEVPA